MNSMRIALEEGKRVMFRFNDVVAEIARARECCQ